MRRILIVCGLTAAVILLVLALRQRDSSARAANARAVGTSPAVAAEPTTQRGPHSLGTNVAVAPSTLDREYGETRAPAEDPLTAYKRINQYPPTSRPLSIHHDLVTPNRRYESPQHAAKDSDVTFWFSGDKGTIVGDDVLHAFLEVRRDGEPIDVRIVSATADKLPLTFTKNGERYVNELRLADAQYDTSATVNVRVEFDYGGGMTQEASFPVLYTPKAGVPARFTGTFREAIVNGSLVIYAGIEVKKEGWYLIDANLWAGDDAPVAWTRYKGNLGPSNTEVPLEFFGKVLVDAKSPAPYQVRQLRGARHVENKDPDLENMPFFDGTYTTRTYPLSTFSPAEWDSEHKREMIRLLSEQQQTGRHNPASGGDPALAEPHGLP
ncbi:MAG TPA: hypothetical protein VFV99_16305 [Kofleriaceae bacterium]|nr:hypothetical protein [Kofleriaceae bacterium]